MDSRKQDKRLAAIADLMLAQNEVLLNLAAEVNTIHATIRALTEALIDDEKRLQALRERVDELRGQLYQGSIDAHREASYKETFLKVAFDEDG